MIGIPVEVWESLGEEYIISLFVGSITDDISWGCTRGTEGQCGRTNHQREEMYRDLQHCGY